MSNLLRTRRWTLDEYSNRRVEDMKALERDRYNFEIREFYNERSTVYV